MYIETERMRNLVIISFRVDYIDLKLLPPKPYYAVKTPSSGAIQIWLLHFLAYHVLGPKI